LQDKELHQAYKDTLKAFYGVLKSADQYLKFYLLTSQCVQGYLIPYTTDGRQLVKVGANFSAKERNLEKWISIS